jgi:hypothetical protein
VPALSYSRRDRERDQLTDKDEQFILWASREIVEDLGENRMPTPAEEERELPKARILAIPARDEADRLALEMLQNLLDPHKWEMEVAAVEMLSSELVSLAAEQKPALICIGSLPPGGLAHTRYLCKRLRTRLPKARILVGRWGLKGNLDQNRKQLQEAGADQVGTTLLSTRNQLSAWLPILAQELDQLPQDGLVKKKEKV